ncbi:GGDEF domain-containing protein [Ferrimonas balearica]|uniref:GGDEF domain-containing protein n=1 Tax=Ferrimonas balearica TaxID=44012 RepID=UPI001C9939BA|nr:GGDEF domain-containing protein [Ferrimonas balearica]MBY5993360.1 GGDEF domain-containing protein [Ferrimonas balearica]
MELDPRPVQHKGMQWLLMFATLALLASWLLYELPHGLVRQLPHLVGAGLCAGLWLANRAASRRRRFELVVAIEWQALVLGLLMAWMLATRVYTEPAHVFPLFSAYVMFVMATVLGLHSADRALLLCILPSTLVLLWPNQAPWWQEAATLTIALYLGLSTRRQLNLWMRMSQAQLRQNRRLLEKFRTLSNQDPLTGLANRRYLEQRLDQAVAEAKRTKGALALILLDVDYFKRYNDHFGHQAGDECLKTVAQILRQSSRRQSDILARLGGEEFVLLLPATDRRGALRLAQEIETRLKDAGLPHPGSTISPRVTLSQGVAQWYPGLSAQSLLHQADKAMYQAKLSGRNGIQAA